MNYPPGSKPPSMSPPPGGAPFAAAPPPKKSGAMKWVLIGCGGITLIGVICCAGVVGLTWWAARKVMDEAVAQIKPILEGNERVKAEIGEVKSVNVRWDNFKSEKVDGRDHLTCTLDVTGERGKGQVLVNFRQGEDKETAYVTLTFQSAQGKTTSLGTWKSDRRTNKFTRTDEAPAND